MMQVDVSDTLINDLLKSGWMIDQHITHSKPIEIGVHTFTYWHSEKAKEEFANKYIEENEVKVRMRNDPEQ